MSVTRRLRGACALVVLAVAASGLGGGVAHADTAVFSGVMKSFDATNIAYTVFLPADASPSHQVPVIFMTHGWGGSRTTAPDDATVKLFTDNDYAVATWDSRGFGTSGGDANTDSQEFEVRDLQSLITLVANGSYNIVNKKGARDILTDDGEHVEHLPADCLDPDDPGPCFTDVVVPPNDPRMGMFGGSYAGGIQLMGASADPRIDAIAPQIAWNDLVQALKPNGVLKLGWDALLYADGLATSLTGGLPAGETGSLAPQIHQSFVEGIATNDWSQTTLKWFDAKSPKNYINGATIGDNVHLPGLSAPTLIIQGTSDTLFNLNQGLANYNQIRARIGDEKTKMIWFCGGHSITPPVAVPMPPANWPTPLPAPAPTNPPHTNITPLAPTSCAAGDQNTVINDRVIRWMDRWVRGNGSVTTGAPIEYQLQDGSFHEVTDRFGNPTSVIPTKPVAAMTNIKSTATHLIVPTSGEVTAPTPAGCAPDNGTGAIPSAQAVRDRLNYEQYCTYPFADWIPLGTYTGTPPYKCGPVVLKKKPCLPTFEQIKPGSVLLGSPHLHLRLTGTPAPESEIFFKLIDYTTADQTRVVIDDHVTPLKASWLDLNNPQYFDIDMDGVAWKVLPGHVLFLEMSPSSNDYANSRFPGEITAQIDASIPGLAPFGNFNTERLTFGPTAMAGTSAPQTVTLKNTGTGPLSLGSAALNQFTSYGGPVLNITTLEPVPSKDYKITADGCSGRTLQPDETCDVSAVFNPSQPGTKVAGLLVPGLNGPVQPLPVLFFGTATTPLNPSPTRIGFGFVLGGTVSAPQQAKLQNLADSPITVTSITTTGDAAMFPMSNDSCSGATLNPGDTCTVDVSYAPTTVKAHVATLKFNNTGVASCATTKVLCEQVVVSGTADKQPPSANMTSPTSTEVDTGAVDVEMIASDAVGVVSATATFVNVVTGAVDTKNMVCVTGCGTIEAQFSLIYDPGVGNYNVYTTATNVFGLTGKSNTASNVVSQPVPQP